MKVLNKILFLGASSQITKSFKSSEFYKIVISKNKLKILSFKDFNNYEKIIQSFKPNIIINTFVFHPVDLCEKNKLKSYQGNVMTVKKIIAGIKNKNLNNPLLIHFSSDYVYNSFNKNYLSKEKDLTNPVNVLGKHKVISEDFIINNYYNYIIFRISWLFSKFDKNFVRTIYNVLKKNEIIRVIDNQYGNPTSTILISKILFKIFSNSDNKLKREVYNLCNIPSTSWFDFANQIKKNIKTNIINKSILPISYNNYYKYSKIKIKRPYNSSMNTAKVTSHFKISKKDLSWKKDLKLILKGFDNID